MSILKKIKEFPDALGMMFAIFLLLPVLSYSAWGLPWASPGGLSATNIVIKVIPFYILPWFLSYTLAARSYAFLFLFASEITLISVYSVMSMNERPQSHMIAQFSLLAVAVLLGAVLTGKDLVIPFLNNSRRWRKMPRLLANLRIHLLDGESRILVQMEDCSMTGIALAGNKEVLTAYFEKHANGQPIRLELVTKSGRLQTQGETAWFRVHGSYGRAGLRIPGEVMAKIIGEASFSSFQDRVTQKAQVLGRIAPLRWSVMILWGVSMAGAIAMPAWSRSQINLERDRNVEYLDADSVQASGTTVNSRGVNP